MSHALPVSERAYVLITPEETRMMDHAAGRMLVRLMEQAGLMAARCIRQHYAPCRVVVACGPGNNGGDGLVLARTLQEWGWPVTVAFWKLPQEGTFAASLAECWTGPVVPFTPEEAERADLVVDALFGAGLSRALPLEVEAFLAAARNNIAVDMPSGVDGRNGALLGNVADYAMTIALSYYRPGHFLFPAAAHCGCVKLVDIGLPECSLQAVKPRYWLNHPGLWAVPHQNVEDHKYRRGVVAICGGVVMPGAALLATKAARLSGAGLVRLSVEPSVAQAYRFAEPCAVVSDTALEIQLQDGKMRVWLCGPGLTRQEVETVMPLLLAQKGRHVVADAGALHWAEKYPERLRGVTVITPHLGEFERLFGPVGGEVGKTRLEAVERAALLLNAVVVLKGADTLIAAPDGRVAVNRHASPALATAGAGDMLCGIIGSLLAAGMPTWEASCAAVWIHGEAGLLAASSHGGWPGIEATMACLGRARQKAEGPGNIKPRNIKEVEGF